MDKQQLRIIFFYTFFLIGNAHASPELWFQAGQQSVAEAKQLIRNEKPAKNVILFLGDGMGISTITAARIFDGQQKGGYGEENSLSFEKLPYLALSKTYSVNQQTPDSAPTMTAIVTGVKTNADLISVNENIALNEPDQKIVTENKLPTILEQAKFKGLSVGVVSTARITHATPAATYAHTSNRDWEADSDKPANATVTDIAAQLIDFESGSGIDVALGGGRAKFLPNNMQDPEYGINGKRKDGRDLTGEWLKKYPNAQYVWNKTQFDAIDANTTEHLLGLFEPSHMHYEADRLTHDQAGEPSLTEMTGKAIDILKKNKRGFFLMVESGRIDHAHHAANAYRALSDTQQLAAAVQTAIDKTGLADTLIIVTADHSHVFTIGGYPHRGNPILGLTQNSNAGQPEHDLLGLPYTTLNYANGPGYTGKSNQQPEGSKSFATPVVGNWAAGSEGHMPGSYSPATGRPVLNNNLVQSADYLQEAVFPLPAETHGGEDVAIFAGGPYAHLFHGVMEQNVIYHVMAEALGLNSQPHIVKHQSADKKPLKNPKQ
jgi:alkaline phosphatase